MQAARDAVKEPPRGPQGFHAVTRTVEDTLLVLVRDKGRKEQARQRMQDAGRGVLRAGSGVTRAIGDGFNHAATAFNSFIDGGQKPGGRSAGAR